MRLLKNLMTVVFVILCIAFVKAASSDVKINPESNQIHSYLTAIDFEKYVDKETKFNISFMVTAQNEIIVVATDNSQLDEVLKATLNYKKISMKGLEYNVIYTVPVSVK